MKSFSRLLPTTLLVALIATGACSADTDGDGLSDAEEADLGTSPVLADTDGDGLDDYMEVVEFGFDAEQNPTKFNPLVADVPRLSFELTTIPAIELVAESSETFGISETSENASSYTTSRTDTNTHSVEMTHTAGVSVSQELDYGPFSFGSTEVELSYEFSHSTTNETSVSFGSESTKEMREALEQSHETSETLTGGKLAVVAKVRNQGDLAFTLTGFSLSALQRDARTRTEFAPIATLEPESLFGEYPNRTLGPNQSMDDVIFANDQLTVGQAQALLADPDGLVLKISSYELVNEEGVPFSHANTEINAKTATIIVDYGPGIEPERYMVATNVARDADGLEGVKVGKALRNYLHIDYEVGTVEATDRNTGELVASMDKLSRVRDVAADPGRNAYWIVSTNARNVADEPFYSFEDITLKAGDVLHLVYQEDEDFDGLGTREEFLYGTDETERDSDGDGIEDYSEVRKGWFVAAYGERVYSDPTNSDDYDGDTLNDKQERLRGTDPRAADTDGDGIRDDADDDNGTGTEEGDIPTNATLHLKLDNGFHDWAGFDNDAHTDYWHAFATDRFGYGERAYDFGDDNNAGDGFYHAVMTTGDLGLGANYSFAVWMKGDSYNNSERVVGVGHGTELFFGGGDRMRFGTRNGVYVESPVANDTDQWTFYTGSVSFDGQSLTTLRLYKNGALVAEKQVAGVFMGGNGCSFFVGNTQKTGDGCTTSDEGNKLDAVIDDVRVYNRALTAEEVDALYRENGYPSTAM